MAEAKKNWTRLRKSVVFGCLALLPLFLGPYYSHLMRQDNTVEVWRNLAFITYPEATTYFKKEGVDINSRGTGGETFLMTASQEGMENTAQIMIDFKADVNAKDDEGKTALQLARQSKNRDVVRLLLKHGAR